MLRPSRAWASESDADAYARFQAEWRRGVRHRLLLALPLAFALGVAAALAYYSSTGSGNASAGVGGLNAPTISSATGGAGTVALSWSTVSPPPPGGSVTYYVNRGGGAAGGNCPTSASPSSATS